MKQNMYIDAGYSHNSKMNVIVYWQDEMLYFIDVNVLCLYIKSKYDAELIGTIFIDTNGVGSAIADELKDKGIRYQKLQRRDYTNIAK